MSDIAHRIGIEAPIDKVYEAITTLEGLQAWWTEHVEGEASEGGKITFKFPESGPTMEILELDAPEFIKWRCSEGVEAWQNTILTFDLREENGQTILLFGHCAWEQESDFMAHCSMKWATFLLSLKSYCESGKGQPFPQDIQIEKGMGEATAQA